MKEETTVTRPISTKVRPLSLAATLALAGLHLAGCDDDDKTATDTGKSATCAHDILERDLNDDGPMGPAVDPATGELKLEAGKEYVVSSTYGIPKPGADGAPITARYLQLFTAIQEQLQHEPGLLALRLSQSDTCGSGRTLAIWKSEEDMYHFVTSDAHVAAMSAAQEVLMPGYAVIHWNATSSDQMTFEEAVRQLAKEGSTR